MQYKKLLLLPVIFHNLHGVKQLSQTKGTINCIPSTDEKYISFSKKIKQNISIIFEIRFIDSFKFMQTSFSNLVSNSKFPYCWKRNPISVIWLLLTLWTLIRNIWLHHNMNFLTNLTNKNSLDISHKHRVLSEFTEPNKDEERVIQYCELGKLLYTWILENYCLVW